MLFQYLKVRVSMVFISSFDSTKLDAAFNFANDSNWVDWEFPI